MHTESLIGVVKAGTTAGGKSMIVVVPKTIREMMSLEKGTRFAVSVEGDKRIVYEQIEHGQGATSNVTPTRDSRAATRAVEQ
jgi:antitoxin component of MazEF toxin-antitoxin module